MPPSVATGYDARMYITLALALGLAAPPPDAFAAARQHMVERHLKARGIRDLGVLAAMGKVPRHLLVPEDLRDKAYADHPLPIGSGQTISQPFIVALMSELAGLQPGMKVLDVGTGSGYQAAVAAEIVGEVHSIEIVCELADRARTALQAIGYRNITVTCGDGWQGLPDKAPFDAILLAAAPEEVPPALIAQLKPGGKLVLPVGPQDGEQTLLVVEKAADGTIHRRNEGSVRFVPMTGAAQAPDGAAPSAAAPSTPPPPPEK